MRRFAFLFLAFFSLYVTSAFATEVLDSNAVEPFDPIMDMQTWNHIPEYARSHPVSVACPSGEFITGFKVVHGASILLNGFFIDEVHCSSRDFSIPPPTGEISEEGRRLLTTSDFRCPAGHIVTGMVGLVPTAGNGMGAALFGLEMICHKQESRGLSDDQVEVKVIDPGEQFNSLLKEQPSVCPERLALSELFLIFYDRHFFGFSGGYCSYVGEGVSSTTMFRDIMRLPTKEDIREDLEEGREQGAEGWVEEGEGDDDDDVAGGDSDGGGEDPPPPDATCEEGFELNDYGVCREIDSSGGEGAPPADVSGDDGNGEEDGDLPPSDGEDQDVDDDEKDDEDKKTQGGGGSGSWISCSLQPQNQVGLNELVFLFLIVGLLFLRSPGLRKIFSATLLFISLIFAHSVALAETNQCGAAVNGNCLPSLIILPLEASDKVLGYSVCHDCKTDIIGHINDHRLPQTAACREGSFIRGISIQKSPHGEIYVITKVHCSDDRIFSWNYPRFASSSDDEKYQLSKEILNLSCPEGHVVSGIQGVMPLLPKEVHDFIRKEEIISIVDYKDTFPEFGGYHSLRLFCSKKEGWGINGSYTTPTPAVGYFSNTLDNYEREWWNEEEFRVRSKIAECPPGTALESLNGVFGTSLFHGITGGICASGSEAPQALSVQFSNETHLSSEAVLTIEGPQEIVKDATPGEILGGYECPPSFGIRGFRVFTDGKKINHVAPLCAMPTYFALNLHLRLDLPPITPTLNYKPAESEATKDLVCPYGYFASGMQFMAGVDILSAFRILCLPWNWYASKIEEVVAIEEALLTALVGGEEGTLVPGKYICAQGALPVGWVIRATAKGKEMRGRCRGLSLKNPFSNFFGGLPSLSQGNEEGEGASSSFEEIMSHVAEATGRAIAEVTQGETTENDDDDNVDDVPPECDPGFELSDYGVCREIDSSENDDGEGGEEGDDGGLPPSGGDDQKTDDEKKKEDEKHQGVGNSSSCSLQMGLVNSPDLSEFFPLLLVGFWLLRRRLR